MPRHLPSLQKALLWLAGNDPAPDRNSLGVRLVAMLWQRSVDTIAQQVSYIKNATQTGADESIINSIVSRQIHSPIKRGSNNRFHR